MDVQLCKYVCDNGFAHGAREIGAKMITNMEQENFVKPMIYDLNNKIKEQKDFIVQLQLLNMDSKRDVAILNSLANYTYTHQLLKCKAFCFKSIVLQLILVLLHFGARGFTAASRAITTAR